MKHSHKILAASISFIVIAAIYFLIFQSYPKTLKEQLITAIIDFKKSGAASKEIDLQSFTERKIRKICDQTYATNPNEFKQKSGENIEILGSDATKNATVIWVFYVGAGYELIRISPNEYHYIGSNLSSLSKEICSFSSRIKVFLHGPNDPPEYQIVLFKLKRNEND